MAKTIIKKPARAAVKAPAKPTVITSIRLQTDIKAALDKASEAEERSVSWLVAKVMSDWLRSKKYLK